MQYGDWSQLGEYEDLELAGLPNQLPSAAEQSMHVYQLNALMQ